MPLTNRYPPEAGRQADSAQSPRLPEFRPLVDDVVLSHGPRELIGSLILRAYAACRQCGVDLSFAPIEMLVELNRKHINSWAPLLGVFDHRLGQIDDANSYCIIGRNHAGDIVYTRAARLYDIQPTDSFKNVTEEMRHLYGASSAARANESWSTSGEAATAMAAITGRVAFSGAVWCHPDYRRLGFTRYASHLGRALSLGKWNNDYTVTFMAKSVVDKGHAVRTGYSNVVWTIHARGASIGDLDIAFLWFDQEETLAKIATELSRLSPQVDQRIINRK